MFKKIITYFIILAVVLPIFATVIPFGGAVKTVYATEDGNEFVDPCDLGTGKSMLKVLAGAASTIVSIPTPPSSSVWNCAVYTATWTAYSVGLKGSVLIAGWASGLFNLSAQFSLGGDIFRAERNPMIEIGWTMVRDLFNLVFIFILLYAAISTILQYGNMDIKKILPGLIVAALLVNFSLMISKVVIDASHVFSFAFYDRINTTDNGKYAEFQNDLEINEAFKKKNLADVFLAGFNPQSLLVGNVLDTTTKNEKGEEIKTTINTESQWFYVVSAAQKKGEKFMDSLWKLLIIIGLEMALAIFSAFILIVMATMLIVRVVVLMMVMIFSPIAFLGLVLPSMGKYSKKWWDTLINQAFFAPAFLFMFMLSTEFVNSKIIQKLLNITPNNATEMIVGMNGATIINVVFNFIIMGTLMWLSLHTAKLMGGYSAEFAQKGRGLILGGANKMLWKPTRYGSRYLGGWGADKTLKSEGRISGVLKAIPGVSVGLRKLGAMRKADEDKERKAAEKYAGTLSKAGRTSLDTDKERGFFGRAVYGGGVFKSTREGYEKIIEKKKAEGEERGRIAEKMLDLMGSHFDKFAGGLNREDAKKKVEGILLRGNTEELDKWIEAEDRAVEKEHNEAIDKINGMKRDFDNKIKEINDNLTKARSNGDNTDELMKKLKEEENKAYENNKKLAEIITKGKHRENLQKGVDKYEEKQSFKSEKPESKKEDKAKIK